MNKTLFLTSLQVNKTGRKPRGMVQKAVLHLVLLAVEKEA